MKVEIITDFGKSINYIKNNNEPYTDRMSPEAIKNIQLGLQNAGYEPHIFGGIPELTLAFANKIPIAKDALYLNISNGMTQDSRRMQAPVLCDMLEVKYTGSAPFAVALMNNKHFTKKAVQDIVKIPHDVLIDSRCDVPLSIDKVKKFPVIVKPNGEGGSYGITQDNVVYNKQDAVDKSQRLLNDYTEVLVEELIPGIEITNLIIGNKGDYLLNEIMVYKTQGEFEHKDLVRGIDIKTNNDSEIYSINTYTSDKQLIHDIQKTSINIFEKLGCRDIARIDYKIDPTGELFFLEINSNPNIYSKYIDVICKKNEYTYSEFLSLLIQTTWRRYRR